MTDQEQRAERDPLGPVLEAAMASVEYHAEREAEYPGYVWIEWDDLVRFVEEFRPRPAPMAYDPEGEDL